MKIAIIGYGRMGKTIEKLAIENGHEIVLKIGRNNLEDLNEKKLKLADVAIEFSNPESAFDNISSCIKAKLPVVSGTTGWLDKMEKIKTLCNVKQGSFFYASNFSIGVNIFMAINRNLAKLMNNQDSYDVSMREIHHIHKKDAPSGTAITLAEEIINELERKDSHITDIKPNTKSQILIESERLAEVPGTHIIKYASKIDTIQISHEAHNRKGFALGAILAAQWLIKKKGIFGMRDLLGI